MRPLTNHDPLKLIRLEEGRRAAGGGLLQQHVQTAMGLHSSRG
jgi:hypothetical protein